MKTYYARIRFKEDILGTSPADPKIQEKFVSSKIPDTVIDPDTQKKAEIAGVTAAEAVEKSMTVFYRNQDGQPILMPYQVAGFLKSAAKAINGEVGKGTPEADGGADDQGKKRKAGKKEGYIPAYKSKIDQYVFVSSIDYDYDGDESDPGIVLHLPEGGTIGDCQRPLRAETLQGPRTALANSESLPKGTWCEFKITVLLAEMEKMIPRYLDYGKYNGMCQWRNSGKGRFKVEEIKEL